MARILFDNLRLHNAVLEIRYPRGYRYWDVCGKCILDIVDRSGGDIEFEELRGGEECILIIKNQRDARASFGFRHMTVSASYLRNVSIIKDTGSIIFDVIQKNLEIKNVDRIGFRLKYVYGTATPEEADGIVRDMGLLTVAAERLKGFGDKIEELAPAIVTSQGDRRVRIAMGGATRREDIARVLSSEDKEFAPKDCVLIDMDFYQENIEIQKINVEKFVHACYKDVKENINKLLNK